MNETHLMSNFDGLSIVMNILNETVCQVNKSFIVNILSLVYGCIVWNKRKPEWKSNRFVSRWII